ncbi:MAG: T9SS type A sorting domain-containing protein [Flavobacteriaceae bacterium]|nr:T9SS type A sorting domain-containing protein [Flavobacteriaceae bacterium]
MKNLLLIPALICFVLQANAQFHMTTKTGEAIENEQTFSFNTTLEDIAKVGYIVHNDTSNTIIMKAEVEAITGSDGSLFELCFGGSCYFDVSVGLIMPVSPVAIPAGGIQGMFDHFWNKNTSNSIIEYRIKFFQLDGMGNPTGEPFYINYIYNENLSTSDIRATQDIKVLNTLVRDQIQVQSQISGNAILYAMDGKAIQNMTFQNGLNIFNVSHLKPGNYILHLKGENGNFVSTRIMLK